MDNNRKFKRYVVEGIHGNVLFTSGIEVINMSVGGAAVETTRRLELNREYTFRIKYKTRYLTLKGRIVWATLYSKKKKGSKDIIPVYRAGIKFTGTLNEEAETLLDFIKENKIETSEHRSHGVRFKIAGTGDVKLDLPYSCTVKKLSRGGMLVETEYPLDINSHNDIELYLGEHKLNVVGRVTNCEKNFPGDPATYEAGIEFVAMSDKDEELLGNFLKTLD